MTTTQREEIYNSLLDIRKRLNDQKMTFHDLLLPYNRLNRSYIQENDFLRAMKSFPTAPVIAKNFSNNGIISITEVENAINSIPNQPPEPPKTPPYIIFTLARQFQRQNVDFWSMFTCRDRLRTGKVDVSVFTSVLSSTGIRINQEDLNEIIDFYKVQEKVNYVAFIEDIKKANVAEKELIRNQKTSYSEDPDINAIIDRIKSICKGRRVLLSGFFEGYQTPMTFYSFTRLINSANLQLNSREINFLAKFCQIENGAVDPSIIINKVDQVSTSSTVLSDTENTINKIKIFLAEKQLYLTPRFERFDREKSGEFPVSLVNSVLSQYEFPLSEYELDCLQQKYPGSRVPFIKWRDFDADVEPEQLVLKYQEMQTTRRMNDSTPKPQLNSASSSHLFRSLDDNQKIPEKKVIPDNIEILLTEFAKYEIKTLSSIFDDLRDIDNLKLGFIQPYQFNSYMLTIFPRLSRKALESLIQYYGNKEFMYIELCKDIESIKKSLQSNSFNTNNSSNFSQQNNSMPITNTSFSSSSSISSPNSTNITDPDINNLIKKLKAFTVKNILSPSDIFLINDRLRLGYVPSNRLQNCFSLVRFDVTQKEVNMLLKQFCHQDYPDRFYYLPLVNILENMQMSGDEVKWILSPDLARNQIDDNAHLINCQIHAKIAARRKIILDYFAGVPKGRPIDAKEFSNRISKIDIVLEPFELQILIEKYKCNQDKTKVDWEQFCNDVHNVRLF